VGTRVLEEVVDWVAGRSRLMSTPFVGGGVVTAKSSRDSRVSMVNIIFLSQAGIVRASRRR
jgi:hypothetical protein